MIVEEGVRRGRGGRGALAHAAVGVGVVVIAAAATAAMHLSSLGVPAVPMPTPAAAPPLADAGPAPADRPDASSPVRIDPVWSQRVATATGIPVRALLAYASADLSVDAEQPGCGIGWNTLAAIGAVESGHGTHAGAVLGEDGYPDPPIRGIPLDGQRDGVAAIADTDGGLWDGDTVWDRAVGPMQFVPSTWERWAADGNGDGLDDPNQIDDAGLAAARYLCASGSLATPDGWRAAVLSYNRSDAYVDQVARIANGYATAAGAVG